MTLIEVICYMGSTVVARYRWWLVRLLQECEADVAVAVSLRDECKEALDMATRVEQRFDLMAREVAPFFAQKTPATERTTRGPLS